MEMVPTRNICRETGTRRTANASRQGRVEIDTQDGRKMMQRRSQLSQTLPIAFLSGLLRAKIAAPVRSPRIISIMKKLSRDIFS